MTPSPLPSQLQRNHRDPSAQLPEVGDGMIPFLLKRHILLLLVILL
jgi:hypothetical protein